MSLQSDGTPVEAYALVRDDGTVLLSDICTNESSAMELHMQQVLLQPHRGPFRVRRVLVTVQVQPK